MSNIIIIHGAYGNPGENWFPWLKNELEKMGHKVFAPRFPTPKGQSLENWLKVFEDYKQYLGSDTVVVGHSLGPAFLLSVLEQLNSPIRAAFFVAGFVGAFTGEFADPVFDEINKTFAEKTFNWDRIKKNCRAFYIYYSDTDPYVSQDKAYELGQMLEVTPILVKGAGHFNRPSGYVDFQLLLDDMKKEL